MRCFVSLFVVALAVSSCAENRKDEPTQSSTDQGIVATQKIQIPVDGMTCSACQSNVRRTIKNMDGVQDVVVSLKDRNAIITYIPTIVKPEQIQKAINDKGYAAGEPKQVPQ